MSKIIVSHSGRQHSHQQAYALNQANLLSKYITGIPTNSSSIPWPLVYFLKHWIKRNEFPIPISRTTVLPYANFSKKVIERVANRGTAVDFAHRFDRWFDHQVAKRLDPAVCNVVVGYENCCLSTFQRAKELGMTTVLDAASVHHELQDQLFCFSESDRAHERITERKDKEIAIADHIITVSEMARESYLDIASVENVTCIPMGVDLSVFQPNPRTIKSQHLRFVYVGNGSPLKGCNTLEAAFGQLNNKFPNVELTVVGGASRLNIFQNKRNVALIPQLSHSELSKVLSQHDALVLPSKFDSFGMVVAEGMASGLVAIVSNRVGAKQMVVEKKNGLVFESANDVALEDAMAWVVNHSDQLPVMKQNSIVTAQNYSWDKYHKSTCSFFRRILGSHGQ